MNTDDPLATYLDNFRQRVLQDALAEAISTYWQRRAASFDAAMPRPGDRTGRATAEQIEQLRLRVSAIALACRQRASSLLPAHRQLGRGMDCLVWPPI